MTPYGELRQLGKIGPIQYSWLIAMVKRVARANGFPPPGGGRWSDEIAMDWLHGLLAGAKGPEFLTRVAITATDDESFGKLVRRSLKNAFIDEARATVEGRLSIRMRGLLSKEPDFVDFTAKYAGTAAWSLAGLGDSIWSGDWEDLIRAPGLGSIGQIAKLNSAGPTSAANIAKLVGATRYLVRVANGAMTDRVIGRALVRIFDLDELDAYFLRERDAAQFALSDQGTDGAEDGWDSAAEYESPGDWLEILEAADQVFDGLTADEITALALSDRPDAEMNEALSHLGEPLAFATGTQARFRERTSSLSTPTEAIQVVLSRCLKRHFD
jgi:hypothetical protein